MEPLSIWIARILLGMLLIASPFVVDFGLRGLHRYPLEPVWTVPGGDPQRGRQAIREYGCGACHVITGVPGATGRVGPKLDDFVNQMYVGGVLKNEPDNVAAWIRDPQRHSPETAMPRLGVAEQDALDMVAYLYSAGGRSAGARPAELARP